MMLYIQHGKLINLGRMPVLQFELKKRRVFYGFVLIECEMKIEK